MIITTTPFVAGYRVTETRGQVFGLVVRSRGLGGNMVAGLRSIMGGEIHEYTSLLEDTRRQAIDRMVQNATLMGANADHLDALRLDRAGRDDVRDRGLRDRGRPRARSRGGPGSPSGRVGVGVTLARVLVGTLGVLFILGGIAPRPPRDRVAASRLRCSCSCPARS